NSDDAELATHLNTEAAKAMKYGNVSEEDALKFVTLHPAMQLRIENRTGSLEVGKDADLVIWSDRPLSTAARCEQTWIDGRQYFSLEQDVALRNRDRQIRARLMQEILASNDKTSAKKDPSSDASKKVEEEDRWARTDVFCGCRQGNNQGVQDAR
ncbi:MAG: amidohydrolase family protein, partial [Planctomycetaceae bacterium]